jgi:hypothetical protein
VANVFRLAIIRPGTIILIREGVKMYVPVLTAILIFGVIIFVVLRLVKERSAETERAEEEEKKNDS